MALPRIVVTLSGRDTPRNRVTRRQYCASVERLGVEVITVAPGEIAPTYFDGLYLSGGEDIHPRAYGEEISGSEDIDEARDKTERELLGKALDADLPVLGICRGFQLLNVHFGGTLEQHRVGHSPKYPPAGVVISSDPEGAEAVPHLIRPDPGTRLAEACGVEPFTVNSSHHQMVTLDRFATRSLRTTARVDGVIEALESVDHSWVVGVQWHPERTKQVDEAAGRIFEAFVRAAERVPAR